MNNLYNTSFWALVQDGKHTRKQAHEALRVSFFQECCKDALLRQGRQGTNSGQKNQLLFERFGINYNNTPERMRKGSVIVREEVRDTPSFVLFLTHECNLGLHGGRGSGSGQQRRRGKKKEGEEGGDCEGDCLTL